MKTVRSLLFLFVCVCLLLLPAMAAEGVPVPGVRALPFTGRTYGFTDFLQSSPEWDGLYRSAVSASPDSFREAGNYTVMLTLTDGSTFDNGTDNAAVTVTVSPCTHSLNYDGGHAPGCESAGWGESWVCSVCGARFADGGGNTPIPDFETWKAGVGVIPAAGHSYGEWRSLDGNYHRRVCAHDASHFETEQHTLTMSPGSRNATCTVDASGSLCCSVCGFEQPLTEKAVGHSYGPWEKLNDTQHRRVCANDATHAETADHRWDSGKVTKTPTCTEAGERTYTCTDCGAARTEKIEPIGHKWGSWELCDNGVHRRVCRNDPEHTQSGEHLLGPGTVTGAPTCTESGEQTARCSICGGEVVTTLEPAGHSWGEWKSVSNTQHTRVCKTDPSHTEIADHRWDEGTVIRQETCGIDGEHRYTCPDCGVTRTVLLPSLDHSWGKWTMTDSYTHQRICTNDRTHVEAEEHSWDAGVVTKAPTVSEDGVMTFTCSVCGGKKEETLPRLELTVRTEATALKAVPEALMGDPELDTLEKLTAALFAALAGKGEHEGTAFYDISVLVSSDGGVSWTEADAAQLAVNGRITVTVPYPEGSSRSCTFTAVHMFDDGADAGTIELLTVRKTSSGLQLTMSGLSPVGIGWNSPALELGDNTVLWAMLFLLTSGALVCAMIAGKQRRKEETR